MNAHVEWKNNMNLKNLKMRKEKVAIQRIFKNYGYSPQRIEGSYVPSGFMIFHGWLKLAGRDIDLYCSPNIIPREKLQYHYRLWDLHRKINEIRFEESFGNLEKPCLEDQEKERQSAIVQSLFDSYGELLTAAYKLAIAEEWSFGLVRVPFIPHRFDEEAEVKSYYWNILINFSPILLDVVSPVSTDVLDSLARLFTEAYIKNIPCSLLDVNFGQEVKEDEILSIYKMTAEVIDVLNKQQINEFQKKKDKKRYQHREDFDPAKF